MSSKQTQRPIKKILITAGPTREMLDPVRFLSNVSTGEMGYALARSAAARHFEVTLISGPTALKKPHGVRFVPVVSAADMQKACKKLFPDHDALIMSAAVCDFTPAYFSNQKIQRTRTNHFELKQTPDIVAGLARSKADRVVIGFCLETSAWIEKGIEKIKRKHLDGIVANYYTPSHSPFGDRRINTALIDRKGEVTRFQQISKKRLANKILTWLLAIS